MAAEIHLQFGEFSLDRRNACLWHGAEVLKLKPKAFDVLRYLVEHSGQLVSKDDLWRAIWPDVAVTDGVLAVCLTEIRQALGDDAKAPRFIETVHRRGYRFIAPVVETTARISSFAFQVPGEEEESPPVPRFVEGTKDENGLASSAQSLELEEKRFSSIIQSLEPEPHNGSLAPVQTLDSSRLTRDVSVLMSSWPRKNVLFAGLFVLVGVFLIVCFLFFPSFFPFHSSLFTHEALPPTLPLSEKPSLIVLPLVNLSNDPEQDYFSDGLTEVLTGDLSKISSLLVIARNSAFTYKGKAVKVQDISREMGVRYVLEGSVQKANQRIRIAVQLIDATTGYEVWSEQYDRPLTDIFALQNEIVQRIVTTLQLQLTLQEEGLIIRKHTDNLEAYDAFLRGLEHFWNLSKEGNAQARQMYEKAVALDPQYAEAYAQLGFTYFMEASLSWSADPQALERGLAAEQRALVLNDSLPSAHAVLGLIYARQHQYDQAIAEGERAIALDPNNAGTYLAQADALSIAGRPEDALRTLAHVKQLTPRALPSSYAFQLGWAYRAAGRYAEAITTLQEFLSRKPDAMAAHLELAISYWWQWASQQSPADQTLEPAMAVIQRALAFNDSWYVNHMVLGYIYLYQQQYDQALAEVERAVALAPHEAESRATLAMVLSCMGRTEEALEAAAQALRLKSRSPDTYSGAVGMAYAIAGRYEEARAPLQRYLSRYPKILFVHLSLVEVCSELGQVTEAQKEAAEVLRLNPNFSLEVHRQRMPIKDPAVLERHIAALRKAGLK